jgi:hypothetical protein
MLYPSINISVYTEKLHKGDLPYLVNLPGYPLNFRTETRGFHVVNVNTNPQVDLSFFTDPEQEPLYVYRYLQYYVTDDAIIPPPSVQSDLNYGRSYTYEELVELLHEPDSDDELLPDEPEPDDELLPEETEEERIARGQRARERMEQGRVLPPEDEDEDEELHLPELFNEEPPQFTCNNSESMDLTSFRSMNESDIITLLFPTNQNEYVVECYSKSDIEGLIRVFRNSSNYIFTDQHRGTHLEYLPVFKLLNITVDDLSFGMLRQFNTFVVEKLGQFKLGKHIHQEIYSLHPINRSKYLDHDIELTTFVSEETDIINDPRVINNVRDNLNFIYEQTPGGMRTLKKKRGEDSYGVSVDLAQNKVYMGKLSSENGSSISISPNRIQVSYVTEHGRVGIIITNLSFHRRTYDHEIITQEPYAISHTWNENSLIIDITDTTTPNIIRFTITNKFTFLLHDQIEEYGMFYTAAAFRVFFGRPPL